MLTFNHNKCKKKFIKIIILKMKAKWSNKFNKKTNKFSNLKFQIETAKVLLMEA